MSKVALALGGNIGDTNALFREAVQLLEEGGLDVICVAPPHQSAAVDCVPGTPDFWDTALTANWPGTPTELLALCQSIEHRLGRPARHSSRESRTIDIDILLFGNLSISTPELCIPHPRMAQRLFVLIPLAKIAPDWPVGNDTVLSLLQRAARCSPHDL